MEFTFVSKFTLVFFIGLSFLKESPECMYGIGTSLVNYYCVVTSPKQRPAPVGPRFSKHTPPQAWCHRLTKTFLSDAGHCLRVNYNVKGMSEYIFQYIIYLLNLGNSTIIIVSHPTRRCKS